MTQPLRIAIAGLGTVGMGVVAILEKNRDLLAARAGKPIEITALNARDRTKNRGIDLGQYRWVEDAAALADAKDVDVVVELIGGAEGTARNVVEAALNNGKHVVTANKALIATHGEKLARTALDKNISLMFEAAVAGGIPILKLLREGLSANQISRVMGILNGTCNYILTHMWEGKRELADVLAEAQKLGYAEADPTFDIDGIDAAHKLSILAALAYGKAPDLASLSAEGIRGITLRDMQFADELGYTIRLIGVAKNNSQRVYPALVAKDSSLASVRGVYNAVQVEGDSVGSIFVQGRGAGAEPTASAVVADIIDIARGNHSPAFGIKTPAAANKKTEETGSCEYFVRMGVADKPGVLADITGVFRDAGISVKSFLQHGQSAGEKVYIVVATHAAKEKELRAALATIGSHANILEKPFSIRIEE